MSFTAVNIYPNKDPQFKMLQNACSKSQLCTQWFCPPDIIAEICGFALGSFCKCKICNNEIHVTNLFKHKNTIACGYFKNEQNQYFCVECLNARKFTVCNIYNHQFTGKTSIQLCYEILHCNTQTHMCANNGLCTEQWILCKKQCVLKSKNKCCVCESVIGMYCIRNNAYALCTFCQSKICDSCHFGGLSLDIKEMFCGNCKQIC